MYDLFDYIKNNKGNTWTVPTVELKTTETVSTAPTSNISIPLNGDKTTVLPTSTDKSRSVFNAKTTTLQPLDLTQVKTLGTNLNKPLANSISSSTNLTQTSSINTVFTPQLNTQNPITTSTIAKPFTLTLQNNNNVTPTDDKKVTVQTTPSTNTDAKASETTVSTQESAPAQTTSTSSAKPLTLTDTKTTTQTQTDTKTPATTEQQKPTQTMDEFFGKYYKRYNSSSEEEKVKLINRYLTSLAGSPERQAKAFENLRKKGATPEEIERLSKTIDKLHVKVQFKAADAVCNKGTTEQNQAGRRVVANEYSHYDKTVQNSVAQMIVKTKDENAIKTAATHSSDCDSSAQVEVVKTFQKIENKDVNKILIDQYSKYDVKNQLDIHQTMSNSKLSETVEYAASNIGLLNKINQINAFNITKATGNNSAIRAMAANVEKFDKSLQSQIRKMIENSNCPSAKEALAESDASKSNNIESGSSEDDNSTGTSSINSGLDSSSEQIDIANSTDAEKIAMMNSMTPDELINSLGAFMGKNASPELINAAISMLKSNISSQDAGKVLGLVENSTYAQNAILTQLGTLDPTTQDYVVSVAAEKGSLNKIDRDLLNPAAKLKYDDLLEKTKNK